MLGIKNYLSFVPKYLKGLISTLFFYFSLVPAAYELAGTWLSFEVPIIPKFWLASLAVLFFVIANLQIYIRGKRREIYLESKISDLEDNSVNYELTEQAQSSNVLEDLEYIDEQKKKIKEQGSSAYATLHLYNVNKSWKEYEDELLQYEKDLRRFADRERKISRVLLTIKNTGRQSDEDISVTIVPSPNCYLVTDSIEAEKPERPSEPRTTYSLLLRGFPNPDLLKASLGFKVREIVLNSKKRIEVEIFKLRAGEELLVLNDPIVCRMEGKEASLEIEIKTKNTKIAIQKRIMLPVL